MGEQLDIFPPRREPSPAELGWSTRWPGKAPGDDMHIIWTHETGFSFETRGFRGDYWVRYEGGAWELVDGFPAAFDEAMRRAGLEVEWL